MHCYSCGKTTNVIGLVMQVRNVEFLDACKWIEDAFPSENVRTEPICHRDAKAMTARNERIVAAKTTVVVTMPKVECASLGLMAQEVLAKVEESMGDATQSSFARCLTEVFGQEVMERIVEDYQLGAWKANGRYDDVMFPSIDIKGRIRDVKIQAYDCDTRSERFFHSLRNVMYWLGPRLFPDAEFNRECLFGEHLLTEHPDMTVALVESPKNACVGAAHYPHYLWLATGNKNMLRRDMLRVLQGRKVIVFPDEDAFDEWHSKLSTMADIATFLCIHTPGEDKKRDIADYIISTENGKL